MAEESAEVGNVLTRKVGPLPVAAWAGIAIVVWYIVRKKTSSASTSSTTVATGTPAGTEPGTEGTDPAGNTGLIDPATGYVYGTPEDLAALGQGNQSDTGSSGGSSSTQTYTTNAAWEDAAINYLVGLGTDPTEANGAIAAYLASQTLSTTQQAEVNEAIQALGAPPQPPAPTTSTPVVNPPGTGGGPYAANPPTGLAVSAATSSTISLKWNASKGATGYTVKYTPAGQAAQTQTTSQPQITLSGLKPQTSYAISVQATPADAGDGSATTTVTTSYGVVGGPTPPKTGSGGTVDLSPGQVIQVPYTLTPQVNATAAGKKFGKSIASLQQVNPGLSATATSGTIQIPYLVRSGDTVTSIAAKFGISAEHLEQVLSQEGVV
jgi:hypothetical protein